VRRQYLDMASGQLHYREARAPAGSPQRTPVVCLHQTPTSSREFEPLMRELALDRRVVAPDTPGYGQSDGPAEPQSIDAYAAQLAEAIRLLGFGRDESSRPVLFGYHTGAVMAAQIALTDPKLIRGIVLYGFPFRSPTERQQRFEALPRTLAVDSYFEKVAGYFDMHVRQSSAQLSLHERAAIFAQDMTAGPRYWYAYHGVWTWPYEERLPQLAVPSLAIVADEVLADATRAAARIIPGCELREMPQLKGSSALLTQATEIAAEVREFADRVAPAATTGN
jgi:pimeloyl-ACP methyl ester carboxylesterase